MARTYNSGWRDWFATKSADINGNFVVEGLQEQMKQLDALLASNPEMEKKMRRVISKVMIKAQKWTQKEIANDPALNNDPRHAAKAVRKAVYRRILGGNINILNKKKRGNPSTYTPTRTLKSGQRGGNRRLRSERTMRMDSYSAEDRTFILLFLENGARKDGGRRQMGSFNEDPHRSKVKRGSQGGDVKKYGTTVNTGSRGNIKPRNIFSKNIIALGEFIDRELNKEFSDLLKSQV